MLRISLASSLILCASATDRVTLNNGDLFKGDVIGLANDTIRLQSTHSDTPLQILGSNLRHIKFDSGDLTGNPSHSQLINLKNGDSLPGQVTGLDENTLSFDTWFAGSLKVSREHVDSVYFGVTPQKVVFQGPTGIESWDQEDDEWSFYNKSISANKRGTIGRDLSLPENFIFSTKVTWTNSPQLRIFLCSDETAIDPDRGTNNYLVSISTSGIEVRRQLSKEEEGSRYHSLISAKVNLNNFKSGKKELVVELRVDRNEGEIHLYLNGEYIKHGIDPKTPPNGSCVIYESTSSNRRNLGLQNIIVKEWDTVTQNLQRESRVDKKNDTLVTTDADRYSGSISDLGLIDDREHFTAKIPLLDKPLPIPVEDCVVLYFSEKEDHDPDRPPFKLAMHSGGSLSLTEVSLGANSLNADHPALGPLKLDRRILSEITRHEKAKAAPKEAPLEKEAKETPSNPE